MFWVCQGLKLARARGRPFGEARLVAPRRLSDTSQEFALGKHPLGFQAGESAGLKTEGMFAQGEFLTRIAQTTWRDKSGFAEWTPARTRQFQTLTHPEHLGRQFGLLLQTR